MGDFHGQVSCRPELHDILLYDRGSHPPALRAGSGHDLDARSDYLEPWVLELKVGEVEGRLGIKEKRTSLGPL